MLTFRDGSLVGQVSRPRSPVSGSVLLDQPECQSSAARIAVLAEEDRTAEAEGFAQDRQATNRQLSMTDLHSFNVLTRKTASRSQTRHGVSESLTNAAEAPAKFNNQGR